MKTKNLRGVFVQHLPTSACGCCLKPQSKLCKYTETDPATCFNAAIVVLPLSFLFSFSKIESKIEKCIRISQPAAKPATTVSPFSFLFFSNYERKRKKNGKGKRKIKKNFFSPLSYSFFFLSNSRKEKRKQNPFPYSFPLSNPLFLLYLRG